MELEKKTKKFKYFMPIATLLLTAIMAISAVITILILLNKGETKINAQILSKDELTIYAPEQELNARYTYAGEEVAHLWKIKVRFINSGNKTIITQGSSKNILTKEGLNFIFSDIKKILRIQELDANFKSSITQAEANKFQINFVQWRENEYIDACFYVSTEDKSGVRPLLSIPEREIIDGDVHIEDLTIRESGGRRLAIDYLPKSNAITIKIIIGLIVIGFSSLAISFLAQNFQEKIRFSKWMKDNAVDFRAHIKKIHDKIPEEEVKDMLDYPFKIPEQYRVGFKNQRFPPEGIRLKTIADFAILMSAGTLILFFILAYLSLIVRI